MSRLEQAARKTAGGIALSYAEAVQIDVGSIPVIDITGLEVGGDRIRLIGSQMREAAEGIGFFYIQGHAIPPALIEAVLDVASRFFVAPLIESNRLR